MKRYTSILFIQLVLFGLTSGSSAQESIIISDSLFAHAEVLEVDAEYQLGRNRKFKLGNYSIYADESWSGTESDTKERLTGLRVVTDIVNYFSFTITDGGPDTAEVYMENKNRVNNYYPNAILENFIIEHASGTKFISLAAWITMNGDTISTWTFYVPKSKGKDNKFNSEMLLTDGEQYINISSVSSDAYFDYARPRKSLRKMPAMGVEFLDSGQSVCAVQYDGGAAYIFDPEDHHSFGCKAWMDQHLDSKTGLVMAAAMSTLILLHNPYLAINE